MKPLHRVTAAQVPEGPACCRRRQAHAVLLAAALFPALSRAAEFQVMDRLTVGGPTVVLSSTTVSGALGVGGSGLEGGTLVIRSTSATGANPVLDVRNNAGNSAAVVLENGNVGINATVPAVKLDVAGDAQFGSGVLKSTFSATPDATTYALSLSSGVKLANGGGIEFEDGTHQYTASSGGGGPGTCPSDMAQVGSWCVDKYEASVWNSASCMGTQYGVNGAGDDNYPAACNDNGEGCVDLIFACSLGPNTTKPSTWIIWFQAAVACANAGKELLPNAVWQMAASGTPDPGTDNSVCNVASLGTPANTGALSTCVSDFGVLDMAGNVSEWTANWISAGGTGTYGGCTTDGCDNAPWPAGYGSDGVWNLRTRAINGPGWVNGIPSVVLRGGNWSNGADAGVFAFHAGIAPSSWGGSVGFRCGRPR